MIKEDAAGAACYRLHETMREYARLKLHEAGEQDEVEPSSGSPKDFGSPASLTTG